MGMYDEVKGKVKCGCGATVDGFQTKDLYRTLETYTAKELFKLNPRATWHSSCDKCGKWHEYGFSVSGRVVEI